ncbi:2Fe-2S iron-sulfur cluster-binding protein [Streptomyces sp. NPDC056568]|uniref:2Fe-2S iron-sulfur cluster-binding protein n=1 Tax=Streptomyces sp. NPDC056568 TaxID=3345866 RepID=UPI00368A1BDD
MTDDQHDDRHGQGTPPSGGRWDPLPQGDYDDGATAFVKLPEGGVDALLASADSPLAAPGHGYVPPQITVAPATTAGTDPAATGTWVMPSAPVDGSQWGHPDPGARPGGAQHGGQGHGEQGHPGQPEHAGHPEYADPYPRQDPYGQAARYDAHAGQGDRFAYRPGATGQWDFSEAAADGGAAPAPGQDVTGQWSIPVADGELPDESGEFTTSSLAEQWGGAAPATLPGGAPAPWAPQPAGQPWDDRAAQGAPAAGEEPAEAPSATRPAPGPAVGPHAEEPPPEGAAATAHPAPHPVRASDEAPADGLRGPAEATEGPAEAPERASEGADTESSPEAAEEPVAGPSSEAAPEEAGEREPEQEPDARPEPVETSRTDAPGDPVASEEPPPAGPREEHPLASYVLRVNGADRPVTDAWIGESLLYVLRERLGLAGAKDGCSQGECGACNVQVDGRLVASCLVPSVTAAGSEVRTVEGLAADGQPSDVQRALARRGAVQCGFCVPGMAMTVHNLLEGNPAPTELEARQALCGNLCRCSGYRGVLEAVREVVAEREAHSAAETTAADADEPRIPHQAGPGAGGVNPSAFESQGPPGTPDTHPHAPHDGPYDRDDQAHGPDDHTYGQGDRAFGQDDQPYGQDDQPYGRDDQPYGQDDPNYGRDDRTYGQDGGHA